MAQQLREMGLQMGLHETKKLLYHKRNGHHVEESANRVEENLCQL
jgi:hypothetical protein